MTHDDIRIINDHLHNLVNGELFTAELSVDGEYANLLFNDCKIYHDSANEDLYSTESAQAVFEQIISELPGRFVGVMKAAMATGFIPTLNQELEAMFIDAENYLCANTEDDDCKVDIIGDFWLNPNYLLWMDEDNNTCSEQYGQIVSGNYRDRSYYRYQDGKLSPAKFYDCEDADVYTYLDKVVDGKGQVWILLA